MTFNLKFEFRIFKSPLTSDFSYQFSNLSFEFSNTMQKLPNVFHYFNLCFIHWKSNFSFSELKVSQLEADAKVINTSQKVKYCVLIKHQFQLGEKLCLHKITTFNFFACFMLWLCVTIYCQYLHTYIKICPCCLPPLFSYE